MTAPTKPYVKHHSFSGFYSRLNVDCDVQRTRAVSALEIWLADLEHATAAWRDVLQRTFTDLQQDGGQFKITQFIADEMSVLDDCDLPRFLYHRYRYDIFPRTHELDEYPPYIQIEPSSVCNFRCVFCYQTDKFFASRKSGMMGKMSVELFRDVVDQLAGNVEFGSLASRGEPLVNPEIIPMLEACRGKFLNMKINTNASLLTEAHAHAILSGSIKTLVFSADAAEEPTYSEYRVNGSLDETLRNIRMFQKIREDQYANVPIITRVSGVMIDDERQNMDAMIGLWSDHVDQVSFVKYNPWENIYDTAPDDERKTPCSDLWRRMFIWFDGKANPCDTDYRSELAVGNACDHSVAQLWRSDAYETLRRQHTGDQRPTVEPCRRCTVV
jgi:radical SAM protein with 4Fe4S-binding SPASM domain